MTAASPHLAPGAVLLDRTSLRATADADSLRGFGGLHGGLVLALLTASMRDQVGDHPLRHVTGQFHRPVPGAFDIAVGRTATGRRVGRATAVATHRGRALVEATASFGPPADTATRPHVPAVPRVEQPERCAPFAVPVEFVPFTQHLEIRPADANLPYVGGDEPSLTAWIRFAEDDAPPDELRLITLLDALAPSYAATLDRLVAIPTIELSVRPSPALPRAESPWVLVRARTHAAADGWVDERLDAWSPAGVHLGSGTQVRLVRQE